MGVEQINANMLQGMLISLETDFDILPLKFLK